VNLAIEAVKLEATSFNKLATFYTASLLANSPEANSNKALAKDPWTLFLIFY